ncbi:MAG: acyl-CoA dehydrogenase family protein [Deltaproteobacteria bacterium]|nr:acyl-CoA dehydrogenase family protein [Deltaproteobacteria bacterium]MBW1923786.1 acyl-CoA dehydrogenase family protein [Deltaproteobacteria bacterium]MBW1949043.1 acyl-CoA dehydrogenase family protein [Deltaproteobacteria bacterium]MBW2008565.1 acyl-CoA dehydrogenase family protein [Deltaproteobacteria bacterium]MBW2103216.1 acyl-CoA dehydrogenase family protein [Deltaproteobacteria bacterium]
MNFELTDEQRMIQDTVKRYLRENIGPIADEYDRKGPMSKKDAHKFLQDLKPFGYVGTLVKEELGGPGLSHLDWAILHEELRGSYASLGGVVGITSSSTHGISESDNEDLVNRVLPDLLNGDKIACTAITEPNIGSNAAGIETRAVLDGDHYVINGTKMWISNGTIADYVVLAATVDKSKGPAGILQLLVEKEVSPFESREIKKMGVKSFPTAEIIFEDCRVPKENVLRRPGEGFKKALRGLTFARCNAAIASVGIAQAAIDAAVRYAKERTQFGKPIGQFQLIQEMVADMVAETDAARLLAYRAFFILDQGGTARKEGSIAKAFATEAGVRVTSKAIQIHGAYGLSEEYPVERYFRDARCYTIPDGTTEIQKLIIGREILGMSAIV